MTEHPDKTVEYIHRVEAIAEEIRQVRKEVARLLEQRDLLILEAYRNGASERALAAAAGLERGRVWTIRHDLEERGY